MLSTETELIDSARIDTLWKRVGLCAANWYAVTYDETQMPFAIFENEPHAIAYRDKFSATSIVEPWPMIIKDMRKPDLKKRAKAGL